jgi:hypothetical protein
MCKRHVDGDIRPLGGRASHDWYVVAEDVPVRRSRWLRASEDGLTLVPTVERERTSEATTSDMSMSRPYEYNLPETAICPGCQTMVVLPVVVPEDPDAALPICGTCGSEVPDPRREAAVAAAAAAADADAEAALPVEQRKYTRGSLFSAIRDRVAEKGMEAIAKRTPPGLGG